jgi:hypothetical protein
LIVITVDANPDSAAVEGLGRAVWGAGAAPSDVTAVLLRGLEHVCAFDADRLVGIVNVAWDCGPMRRYSMSAYTPITGAGA